VVADHQARSSAPAAAPVAAPAEAKRESLPASPAAKSKGGVAGAVDGARLDNAVTPTPPMRESAAALGKLRAEVPRSPAAWLEEIRALMREGKAEEAARQLREFRRTHPDYPLPEEFRQ
jgi:predicted Zn-dependent protease